MYLVGEIGSMQVAGSSDESLGVVFASARQQIRSRAVELSSDKTIPPPLRHTQRSSGPIKREPRTRTRAESLGGLLPLTSCVRLQSSFIAVCIPDYRLSIAMNSSSSRRAMATFSL
jgi:hypothetical protein